MEQVKKQNIVIVGAGITGLTLLHYLKQKHHDRNDVDILLLEKNDYVGGTIHTRYKGDCLFESGPNSFLNNAPKTLALIDELNLKSSVVKAYERAKLRYISVGNKLHQIPTDLKSFLKFKLLNPIDKLRIFNDLFAKKGDNPIESVYDFGKRRFGEKVAKYLLDPFVSGIYAGDAKETIMQTAFPKIYTLEQEHGSVLSSMQKNIKKNGKPILCSFKGGMSEIVDSLNARYGNDIQLKKDIVKIFHREDRFVVSTEKEHFKANELFLCTPAYVTARYLTTLDEELAANLSFISYAPIVVVGLLCPLDAFQRRPKGFGYLVPSTENKEVLGVLFESNIFPKRASKNHILFRVMIGGVRHPEITKLSKKKLIDLALSEIESAYPTKGDSALTKIDLRKVVKETFFTSWERAIPQYDQVTLTMLKEIEKNLSRFRDLYLLGNYKNGISFNSCIENAHLAAQKSTV